MPGDSPKPSTALAPTTSPSGPGAIEGVAAARELFWQNVMREILTSLSILCSSKDSNPTPAVPQGELAIEHAGQTAGDLFDGRLAIITSLGQRIPIAAVYPLFACGIRTSDAEKALSTAVECTVFQVHTPGGEVFTLPLHEIRSFHSLSEQLIEQLKDATADRVGDENEPFGFAAYTSLARTKFPSGVGVVVGPGIPTSG